MTIKVVEVKCDYRLDDVIPEALVECLKRLVNELETVQNRGYLLENNPFEENPIPVANLTFRFVRDFTNISPELVWKEREFGFNPKILWQDVGILELSVRAENILSRSEIRVVHQLVRKNYQEMLRLKNAGKKSVDEMRSKLQAVGLDFGMELPKEIEDSLPPLSPR